MGTDKETGIIKQISRCRGNDGSTQKGDEQMSEKEKKDIQEMVEKAQSEKEEQPV